MLDIVPETVNRIRLNNDELTLLDLLDRILKKINKDKLNNSEKNFIIFLVKE